MLHRLTGFGLVFYLFLHLAALNLLRSGPQSWDRFIALMRSPLFIALDGVLLFGVLFHGLNGLRLTFLGFSRALSWQKPIFWTILSLHTGLHARERTAMGVFQHTWARAQNWGLLVLRPGDLPVTATECDTVEAAFGLEKALQPAAAVEIATSPHWRAGPKTCPP